MNTTPSMQSHAAPSPSLLVNSADDAALARKAQRVFISYSTLGARIARRLECDLGKSGFVVWANHAFAEPGTNEILRIVDGLASVDAFVAIFTSDSATCRWQSMEVALALAGHRHLQRILALTGSEDAVVPPLVRPFVVADVSCPSAYQQNLSRIKKALKTPLQDASLRRGQLLMRLDVEDAALHRTIEMHVRALARDAALLGDRFAGLFCGLMAVGLSVSVAHASFQVLGRSAESALSIVVGCLASVAVGFFHGLGKGRAERESSKPPTDTLRGAQR